MDHLMMNWLFKTLQMGYLMLCFYVKKLLKVLA